MIEELEQLVRKGQFDEVERRLRKISPTKIARQEAYTMANIARRINRPQLAIRILGPIVRAESHLRVTPTAMEKIEYAENLRRVGALSEAWKISQEVDETEYPQVLIHKAFCLFAQWKYQEALPLLQRYIQAEKLEPYPRCVGQINLAAALIQSEEHSQAEELLASLRDQTLRSDYFLLYGNSLELTSQLLISQKDWPAALAFLEQSSIVLNRASKIEMLFVDKWKAIAESFQKNQVTSGLRQILTKAQMARHWETYRECSLYIAVIERDDRELLKLYFGTPFQSYRHKILKFAGPDFQIPDQYIWSLRQDCRAIFDLATARIRGRNEMFLPQGQALHRFFIRLSQDFYRPVSVLTLFADLFPNEFINVTTSPQRIHQIVKRSRQWIKKLSLDIDIQENEGAYHLVFGPNVGFCLPKTPLPLSQKQLEWNQVKNQLLAKDFTSREVSEILNCSLSSAQKLLLWALESHQVAKQGSARSTVYRLLRD